MLDNDASGELSETSLQIEEGKAVIKTLNLACKKVNLERLTRETFISLG